MSFAGQEVGHHHSAQGNLMASDRVWAEMSEAYLGAGGSLAMRLLDALDAGEAAGGDVRGRQSAAILVVPGEGEPWERVVELRVEDHPEPLVELRRLVALKEAYVREAEGDDLQGRGDHDGAAAKYIAAWEIAPGALEMRFWAALSLIHTGDEGRGLPLLRETIGAHEGWAHLLTMLKDDDAPGVAEARTLLGE
jgi:uncharacterized Ntn-hydrolase superfamily protein